MIKSVNIKNITSFDNEGVEINDCQKVNFIYGGNGTGKTTISRFLNTFNNFEQIHTNTQDIIAKQDKEKYADCSVSWHNDEVLPVLVYNSDFRSKCYGQADIPGVFSLGQASKEQLKLIDHKRSEITKLKEEINKINETIAMEENVRTLNEIDFQELTWKEIRKKNESIFNEAFKGSIRGKKTFSEKVLKEYSAYIKGNQSSESHGELVKKAEVIFGDTPIYIELLQEINTSELSKIEENPIWNKVIVGSQDVNISELINSLANDDWVNNGRKYIANNDVCPFCGQETITSKFRNEIEEYFSGEYQESIDRLLQLQRRYDSLGKNIIAIYKEIDSTSSSNNESKLDLESFSHKLSSFMTCLSSNQLLISTKIKEPSRKINLNSSNNILEQLSQDISNANKEIIIHNELLENYKTEYNSLVANIWAFLMKENEDLINTYIEKDREILEKIDGFNKQLHSLNEQTKQLMTEIINDSKNVTSVQPAVDSINNLLSSYDFTGFQILPSKQENYYQIQREDGILANTSLSEGEITLITFLYYLQLIAGGTSTDNVADDRIIAIDDPVASLDIDSMLLVTSLLKNIVEETRINKNSIKQIFIFTHNFYFHKELSSTNGHVSENEDTHYWILHKTANISSILSYKSKNPIRTNYELLWRQLRYSNDSSNANIRNTMIRIIQAYLKTIGGYDYEKLINRFPEGQRDICRVLLRGRDDSYRIISDNLHTFTDNGLSNDNETKLYFTVFKSIFKLTGHEEHYNMMVKLIS